MIYKWADVLNVRLVKVVCLYSVLSSLCVCAALVN